MDSPIGALELIASKKGLVSVNFCNKKITDKTENPHLKLARLQLQEYFAGKRTKFSVRQDTAGTTFQESVWKKLSCIPYGKTWNYGELAKAVDKPKAQRAVGGANNKNPLPIIVPCHRVIGKNGRLTGYAGGLEIKHWLLQHESRECAGECA